MKTYVNLTIKQLLVLYNSLTFYIRLCDIFDEEGNKPENTDGFITLDINRQLEMNYSDDELIENKKNLSQLFQELHLYFGMIIDTEHIVTVHNHVNLCKGLHTKVGEILNKSIDNKPSYTLEFNSGDEMRIYKDTLEFYSRFLAGQIDYLHMPEIIQWYRDCDKCNDDVLKVKTYLIKTILFHELVKEYGPDIAYLSNNIGKSGTHCSDIKQISYEMYREVYVYNYKKQKESNENVGYSVYDSSTMKYSKEPISIIHEIK